MIEVSDINGRRHLLSVQDIARIIEASASSQWHGIRAIVRTADGAVIEVRDDFDDLRRRIADARDV